MQPVKTIVPTKFAHVVLRSERFADVVAWYKLVLGAHASFENEMVSFLTYDDEHHRIAIVAAPGLKKQSSNSVGVHHFAFTYESLADLLLTHERLVAVGVKPHWSVNHGPTTSLYYNDPDGNQIELQVDNFDTADDCKAFFAGPAFSENPVGVDIDPLVMMQRLRAGESEVALKVRPNIGPRSVSEGLRKG